MKLVLDGHIAPELEKRIAEEGYEVERLEGSERGMEDIELLRKASRENAFLVTRDDDFLKLEEEVDHSGIFFITGYQEVDRIFDGMNLVLENIGEGDSDQIFYIP